MIKKKRLDRTIKSKKILYYSLFFVLVGITTMTIAYATLSATLKITGSAEFEDASWEFILEELPVLDSWEVPVQNYSGNTITYGKAKLLEKPEIIGTSINDFKVSLGQLGDEVYLSYVLKNVGEIPAVVNDVIYSNWDITATNDDDYALVEENFIFDVYFYPLSEEDGEIVDGDYYNSTDDIVLCPGEMLGVEIYTGYNGEAARVPYEGVTISDLDVDFEFIAADQNIC